jgi:excisionase family DNA binding protein
MSIAHLNEETLVTVPEAAKLLRLQPSTIRKWLVERRLPRVKLGRRTVLRRLDLEVLVERGRRKSVEI